jgi:ATP-binding cassette, subfamily F, member 3
VISIKGLTYTVGPRTIIDNIELTIADGDRVAIVGPNGAGKSTLLKLILGNVEASSGKIMITKGGSDIGYMPQHLADLGELPEISVLDFMLSGRKLDSLMKTIEGKLHEMNAPGLSESESMRLAHEYSEAFDQFMANGGYDAEGELLEVLMGMGLSGLDLDQDINTLSGGQKTKLAFARVIFAEPEVMILDEPTNHLDEKTIDWAVSHLLTFKGTLVMVSHVPSILDQLVTKIISLDGGGGAVIYRGNFTEFQKKKGQRDTDLVKIRHEQEKEEEKLVAFIDRWRSQKPKQVHDRERKLEKLRSEMVDAPTAQAQISIKFPVTVEPILKVMVATDLCKSFGSKRVLNGVTIDFQRGERVAIMGPNGAGKSTLMKIIAGKLEADSGTVTFGDRVDLGYYAQEHESLTLTKTVLEEMLSVAEMTQSRGRSILAHFLFQGDRVATRVGSLSLGERSRLAMAKLVASGHNLLLLDEPTNHLDVFAREQVKMALANYEGTVLIISHDREFVEGIGVDKILLLPENKLGFVGQI